MGELLPKMVDLSVGLVLVKETECGAVFKEVVPSTGKWSLDGPCRCGASSGSRLPQLTVSVLAHQHRWVWLSSQLVLWQSSQPSIIGCIMNFLW